MLLSLNVGQTPLEELHSDYEPVGTQCTTCSSMLMFRCCFLLRLEPQRACVVCGYNYSVAYLHEQEGKQEKFTLIPVKSVA